MAELDLMAPLFIPSSVKIIGGSPYIEVHERKYPTIKRSRSFGHAARVRYDYPQFNDDRLNQRFRRLKRVVLSWLFLREVIPPKEVDMIGYQHIILSKNHGK